MPSSERKFRRVRIALKRVASIAKRPWEVLRGLGRSRRRPQRDAEPGPAAVPSEEAGKPLTNPVAGNPSPSTPPRPLSRSSSHNAGGSEASDGSDSGPEETLVAISDLITDAQKAYGGVGAGSSDGATATALQKHLKLIHSRAGYHLRNEWPLASPTAECRLECRRNYALFARAD